MSSQQTNSNVLNLQKMEDHSQILEKVKNQTSQVTNI